MERIVKDLCHECGSMQTESRTTALQKIYTHQDTTHAEHAEIRNALFEHADTPADIQAVIGMTYVPTTADFVTSLRGSKDVVRWTAMGLGTTKGTPSFETINAALGPGCGLSFKTVQLIPGLSAWQKCRLISRNSHYACGQSIISEELSITDLTQAQLLWLVREFTRESDCAIEYVLKLVTTENLEKMVLDLFTPVDLQMKCLMALGSRGKLGDKLATQLFDWREIDCTVDRYLLAKLANSCPALMSRLNVDLVVHDEPEDVCSICHDEVGRIYYGCVEETRHNPHYLCVGCGPREDCPMRCESSMKLVRFDPKRGIEQVL